MKKREELDLLEKFENFLAAVNVLKHEKGKSYNSLVSKSTSLTFRIKLSCEEYFVEGDVSEVSTLIKVDDTFVLACADIIKEVSSEINLEHPDFYF